MDMEFMILQGPVFDRPVFHRTLFRHDSRRVGRVDESPRLSIYGDVKVRRAVGITRIAEDLREIELAPNRRQGFGKSGEALGRRKRGGVPYAMAARERSHLP